MQENENMNYISMRKNAKVFSILLPTHIVFHHHFPLRDSVTICHWSVKQLVPAQTNTIGWVSVALMGHYNNQIPF